MVPDDSVSLLREIKTTLEAMRTILEIQARPALKAEINLLASTPERRKMWILSEGTAKTAVLAPKAGLRLRAAKYFVADGRRAGLLIFPIPGCPKRAVNLIPEDWEEVKELEAEAPDEAEGGNDSGPDKETGVSPNGGS